MKKLFPPQQKAHDFFAETLSSGKNTLDSSQMGTGKTVVGVRLARTLLERGLIKNVAVICPKAVIPSWRSELEECGVDPLFVLNIERLRAGKTGRVLKLGKKSFRWTIPQGTLILFDEIHKAKGPWSMNANLLVALVKQGYRIPGMSGTPCESPMEMRPLGYMLGLHNNTTSRGGRPSYFGWLHELGCEKDYWGSYEMTDREYALTRLRDSMYGVTTCGLTVADFPDSFRNNRVIVDPIDFKNKIKIQKCYSSMDISEEEMLLYISEGRGGFEKDSDSEEPVVVQILRARQTSEMLKVPEIVEMAQDAVAEGHSVVLFLNFTESLREAAALLDCNYIDGSVKHEDRDEYIRQFQADETHCLVVNAATGGTGISLHDTHGDRPRLSLISPSFNAKEFAQVIGRIHRNGAKSDALQRVLLSSESVELKVMKIIADKLQAMDSIHRLNLCTLTSNTYNEGT